MTNNNMRLYIDTVSSTPLVINEGVIDNIKNWINTLSSPVKQRGRAYMIKFETYLSNKYGAQVPQEVKNSNKSWMWSKLTYKDIFVFSTQMLAVNEIELDRALKNPIVSNNLKRVISSLPAGIRAPSIPLTSDNIQGNTSPVSPIVDSDTKEYVSKAIASAIIDGISYIEQSKKDKEKASTPSVTNSAVSTSTGITSLPTVGTPVAPDAPSNLDELRAIILAIKQGLANMKGVD